MALNYEAEGYRILGEVMSVLDEVNDTEGLPACNRFAYPLIFSSATMRGIGTRVRKTRDINKRKELIHEFNVKRRIIENEVRRIKRIIHRNAEQQDCDGREREPYSKAANMS